MWVQYEIPPSGPFHTITLFYGRLWHVSDVYVYTFQSFQLPNWNGFFARIKFRIPIWTMKNVSSPQNLSPYQTETAKSIASLWAVLRSHTLGRSNLTAGERRWRKLCLYLRWSSLNSILNPAVQIYDIHHFILQYVLFNGPWLCTAQLKFFENKGIESIQKHQKINK